LAAIPAAIAVIYLALAVFLFRGAAWARYGVIVLILLSLTLGVIAWVTRGDAPNWIALTQVILLVLMFLPGVARWTSRP
jgi:hypothetical protein